MSSAKKDKTKFVLCLHISRFGFVLFYRAKPVTEMERQRNRGALRTNGQIRILEDVRGTMKIVPFLVDGVHREWNFITAKRTTGFAMWLTGL